MADDFLSRMPSRSDADLRAYLERPGAYKPEAVAAAAAELRRRGFPVEAPAPPPPPPRRDGVLRRDGRPRLARIRAVTALILAAGLGAALVQARRVAQAADLDLTESKAYVRQMEVVAGRSNLVASDIRAWLAGSGLVWILVLATLAAALVFHGLASRR